MSLPCRASVLVLLLLAGTATARELRICAEPDNLPFSNRAGEGFENRIAALLAEELGAELRLLPVAQAGFGFLRATLGRGRCDALMALPTGSTRALLTRPYYRSGWMFVSRADRRLHIEGFDDPDLRKLTIGVPVAGEGADTPALIALGARGLAERLRLYSIGADRGDDGDAVGRMVDDVGAGRLDLAVAWGPAAGFHAARQDVAMQLAPAPASDDGIPLSSAIAIAVAKGNVELRDALDEALQRRRSEIETILRDYHVPVLAP